MAETKRKRIAREAVREWCRREKIKLTCEPRHVHPSAYVVGYAAPECLIVAEPWMDSEPQVRKFDRQTPLSTIRCFDKSLKPGDWCITAYVCREGCQGTVAIQVPEGA
jgi:hypothetical protein